MTIIDDEKIIDLGKLLSQPLISTLEADFYTAQRFVEFMTDYGLEPVENVPSQDNENAALDKLSGSLKLKMVTFLYRQIDPSDRQEKLFRVEVPLISLIPLPLLQIQEAEFQFNLRIFSEIDLQTSTSKRGGLTGDTDENVEKEEASQYEQFKGFQARLSPHAGTSEQGEIKTTLDANMAVKIQMKHADLPGGLAYWMSTFNNATSVRPISSESNLSARLDIVPSSLVANDPNTGEQTFLITAALFDDQGNPVADETVTLEIEGTVPDNPTVRLASPATLTTNNNGVVQFSVTVERARTSTPPVKQTQQRVILTLSATTPNVSSQATLTIPEFTA
ncbi:MAG: Ig-like domain-containing protein [Crocosphaera sp.]|nr:Ig-like domain-containing protein [Crocosphaera sp.]